MKMSLKWLILSACTVALYGNPPGCREINEACSTESAARQKARLETVRQVYQNLVYPTASMIQQNPSLVENLFERSVVRGRVNPVGQFEDYLGVEEYFYGLAATPASRVEAVHFTSLLGDDSKVGVQVNIFFCRKPGGGCDQTKPVSADTNTLTQTGFFTFNMNDKIISFDLTILNLGAATNPTSVQQQEANIAQTCALLTVGIPQVGLPATCPTTYPTFQDCSSFMHSIPYGTWGRANSNTFVCRQLHSLLTPFRPDVHCPHVSPSGGGMCVDFPYASFYQFVF